MFKEKPKFKFKVGDKIRCITQGFRIDVGEEFIVIKCDNRNVSFLDRDNDIRDRSVNGFELVKEGKFKVGDRVIHDHEKWNTPAEVRSKHATVTKDAEGSAVVFHTHDGDNCSMSAPIEEMELIKETKVDNLRERIERLVAWGKEADDVIQEITEEIDGRVDITFDQDIVSRGKYPHGSIRIEANIKNGSFSGGVYNSQSGKLRAFKDALLWLAEKSGKLKEKPDFMTASELNKRFNGSNGLELSIEKYERLLRDWDLWDAPTDFGKLADILSAGNCGLCAEKYHRNETCEDCVLYKKWGRSCGKGSPWDDMFEALRANIKPLARTHAEQLLKDLKEIRDGKDEKQEKIAEIESRLYAMDEEYDKEYDNLKEELRKLKK